MSSIPNDKRWQLLLDLQAETDAVDQAETDDVEVEIDGVEISAETGAVNQAETDAVEVETDAVFHSAETDDVEAETDSVERLDDDMPPMSTFKRPIASGYSGMGHGPRRMRGLGGGCHKRIPSSIPKRKTLGSRRYWEGEGDGREEAWGEELRASLRAPSAPVKKDPIRTIAEMHQAIACT